MILISAIGLLKFAHRSEVIKAHKSFAEFPKQIGEWVGKESRFDQEIYDILGVDDSFLGNYRSPEGRVINLYIGYYQSQKEGDIIHSPRNCMPGSGWKITDSGMETIRTAGLEDRDIPVAKLNLQNGAQKQVSLYWFQSRGRIIYSEYWQKIYLVTDSISKRRTDGSFVRLITPINENNEDEAIETLKNFAESLMPILREFIPS
jgi:EpsI family protein